MIRYYLDGVECNPQNRQEITYNASFGGDNQLLDIAPSSLTFVREDYERIQAWRSTWGNFLGMPLDIQYSNGKTVKYLIDFTDAMEVKDRSIIVNLKRFRGWEMFEKRASGLSFNNKKIGWNNGDFRLVDFVVVETDLASKFISTAIMTAMLAKEIVDSASKLSENIESIIEASTPTLGVPPAIVTGAIITAAIRLAINIAYLIALIIALTKLIATLVEMIYPKVRQYKGITYRQLIKKGVEYLGYKLESSVLDKLQGLTVLPKPIQGKGGFFKEMFFPGTLAQTKGYPMAGDVIPTLGTAIDQFCAIFNCEVRVNNDIVKIEQRSHFIQNAQPLKDTSFNLQEELQDNYTINSEDMFKRLVVSYATDAMDFNTFDNTAGTIGEVSSELINTIDKDYELIRDYTELAIPFSRGTRKDELNWFEKHVQKVAKDFDKFLGTSFTSKIEARKGVMQISQLYYGNTKLVYLSGTKLHKNQNQYIGEDKIKEYHKDRFIENNQQRKFEQMPIRMNEEEYFNLIENNFVLLNNGSVAEIVNASWSEENNVAELDYNVFVPAINEETVNI